ncbi:hypothetical protein [Mangrovitalea sediminis]|uniref:hypothetical protein n=1 Tax=Mangrovitalea sediminis TaxID=1982043 RepID=UPI000BE574FD|nr:hypothetical protein [Mangrovitalea sediminis]
MDISNKPLGLLSPITLTSAPNNQHSQGKGQGLTQTNTVVAPVSRSTVPILTDSPVAEVPVLELPSSLSPLMQGLGDWAHSEIAQTGNTASASASTSQENSNPLYGGGFSLKITTREGDHVTLHFNEARGKAGSREPLTSAQYEVDGKLSADERKALGKVVNKMVDLAHSFFSGTSGLGNLAVVNDLSFFDASQLTSFALDLSQSRQHTGLADRSYSLFSLDYSVDLTHGSQHLSSDFVQGYQQKDQAGSSHYGYDLTSGIGPSSLGVLNQTDVHGLGKPLRYESAPTALPRFYQGAVQALASNVDQLAALADQVASQPLPAAADKLVPELFRGLVQQHPAYHQASEGTRQGLNRIFAVLPTLMSRSQGLAAGLLRGSLREQV